MKLLFTFIARRVLHGENSIYLRRKDDQEVSLIQNLNGLNCNFLQADVFTEEQLEGKLNKRAKRCTSVLLIK